VLAGMKKELTWEQHIELCLRSGLSKKTYCEENNLSYQLFFYHQRKLSESKSSSGFKEIILENNMSPDQSVEDINESVLQVQFANGSTLIFSEHLLERVFRLCQGQ
jgi:hypothetical protein